MRWAGGPDRRQKLYREQLEAALAIDGPVIVEAVVDPYEPPLPPMMKPSQAAHIAEALARGEPNRERRPHPEPVALAGWGSRRGLSSRATSGLSAPLTGSLRSVRCRCWSAAATLLTPPWRRVSFCRWSSRI